MNEWTNERTNKETKTKKQTKTCILLVTSNHNHRQTRSGDDGLWWVICQHLGPVSLSVPISSFVHSSEVHLNPNLESMHSRSPSKPEPHEPIAVFLRYFGILTARGRTEATSLQRPVSSTRWEKQQIKVIRVQSKSRRFYCDFSLQGLVHWQQ